MKTDKRIVILIVILILSVSVIMTFTVFPSSFIRAYECVRDIGTSLGIFFCEFFEIPHNITATVTELSAAEYSTPFPETWKIFKSKCSEYFSLLFSTENLSNFLTFCVELLIPLSKFFVILLPLFITVSVIFRCQLFKFNNDYNKTSKPLILYYRLRVKFFLPLRGYCLSFREYIAAYPSVIKLFLLIWAFNFNFIQIIVEAIAFYLYFISSFDISAIFFQLYKLFLDLSVVFGFIPFFGWIVIFILLLFRVRKKIALRILNSHEEANCRFLEKAGVCLFVNGTVGVGKTTVITDMALSCEKLFRRKAFELILELDLKFPNFPWINFERELKRAIRKGSVYNLATCRRFVAGKKYKWEKRKKVRNFFGYDYTCNKMEHNDGLTVKSIWDTLSSYAQLYFIYIMQSSLLVSNYAIRQDDILSDLKNFPLWDNDFFERDPCLLRTYSRHSHIIDYDMLRLGKKVVKDSGAYFEFGVIVISEIGKERGNMVENMGIKKISDSCNRKNDLFEDRIKLIRHSAMVEHFPFVKVLFDDQRPESYGANGRELCTLINISDSKEKLAMPFFAVGELLNWKATSVFERIYSEYRYTRSDSILFMYLLKHLSAKILKRRKRIHNLYGYFKLTLELESGKQDGKKSESIYYVSKKKVYSDRYSTDCFGEYFAYLSTRTHFSLSTLSTYRSIRASFEEFDKQHSHLIGDMNRYLIEDDAK